MKQQHPQSIGEIEKGKAGKSRETCLTNRTRPISHHITPMVINAFGGGHTDTQIHTHTYRRGNQINFKKPGARGRRPRAPGLKINFAK